MRALVPSMLVHTLIENAVKHGVAQVRGHGVLEMAARVADDRLTVEVTDNGPGPDAPRDTYDAAGASRAVAASSSASAACAIDCAGISATPPRSR